jgi:dipeptidase D
MQDGLGQLEPRSLWNHFAGIAATPRPSKHEERIVAWVRALAESRDWEIRSDAVGNLVIAVPATVGLEGAQTVVLQAHLDMVCEKNHDVEHDFMNDPIRPRVNGEWVVASGTTLGADNGIGVAAALAAATDDEVVHGPLELLFTVDEETGLTGAQGLDASLLNMDSEEDGKLFVGCAGGADCHLTLDLGRRALPAGVTTHRLSVTGLRGGHSGLNIHENRGNAVKLVARLLGAARDAAVEYELAGLEGGSKHNAIPREAWAVLVLDPRHESTMRAVVAKTLRDFQTELLGIDEGLELRFESADAVERVLERRDRDRLLDLLLALPHGVLGMSPDIPGLVETSNNLAVVEPAGDGVRIVTSCRSSLGPTQEAVLSTIRAAGRLAGAGIELHGGYPGWKPDMDSKALAITRRVYTELWGKEPEVTAVHAGLECGLLGEKVPGMDMISFGPQIEGAHSPDERVHIESVERFWNALRGVLRDLS